MSSNTSRKLWEDVQEYCENRLAEISAINDDPKHQCPSAFVCIAAFIGFLSRLASGTNMSKMREDGVCFKNFVKQHMPSKYQSEEIADLLYKTFRCGIVHAMSFDPEISENRTVYLAKNNGCTSGYAKLAITHDRKWDSYCNGGNLVKAPQSDMFVLTAQVLCEDIGKAIAQMFIDPAVQCNSEEYVRTQRPIAGLGLQHGAASSKAQGQTVTAASLTTYPYPLGDLSSSNYPLPVSAHATVSTQI